MIVLTENACALFKRRFREFAEVTAKVFEVHSGGAIWLGSAAQVEKP